jgi:hypothetical protein
LFLSDDLQAIIEFAVAIKALGDLNQLVYNATFASVVLGNGQIATIEKAFQAAKTNTTSNQEYVDFLYLQNSTFRKDAYKFWQGTGPKGMVIVRSFDIYNTAINGDYHQLVNGSCFDSYSLSDAAWTNAYANPPTQLIQDYFKCHYGVQDTIITALGVGSGTANAFIPVMIILFMFFIHKLGLPRTKMIKDLYTEGERQKALTHLATHLLMIRDREEELLAQGKKLPVGSKFLRGTMHICVPTGCFPLQEFYKLILCDY